GFLFADAVGAVGQELRPVHAAHHERRTEFVRLDLVGQRERRDHRMRMLAARRQIADGGRNLPSNSTGTQIGFDRRSGGGLTLMPEPSRLGVLSRFFGYLLASAVALGVICRERFLCRQSAQRFGVRQPLDRLDEVAAAEKHFEIDWTATALAANAAVKKSLRWLDRKAVAAFIADRTAADIFAAGLLERRPVRLRDLDHVAGASLVDERVPYVVSHGAALRRHGGMSSGCGGASSADVNRLTKSGRALRWNASP